MAYIDELRQKNPKLQNLSDRQIADSLRRHPDFQGMGEQEFNAQVLGAQPEPQQQEQGDPGFMGGLQAGWNQLQGMGGGLLMAAGDALDQPGMQRSGQEIYQRNMEEAAETSLDYGFTDISSPGEAWQWAKYTTGNLLPMMATSVASGGVGGMVAGTGAKMLAGQAAKEGAKRAGQAIGAYAGSAGMETGAMMGETEDLEVSAAHGALAGALDALTPIRLLRSRGANELADKAASEISDGVLDDLRRRAQQGAGRAMAGGSWLGLMTEATTEGLQGLIGQHANYWVENNGESLLRNLDEVDVKAIVDEGAAGGLMGGIMGAPAGIGERGQARRQVAQIESAREQAAAQGGDALDQTLAAQEAEQTTEADPTPTADPVRVSELGNRLQMAMGGMDDLQAIAKGASYQGQTRLRGVTRLLDNAEQAFEAGEYDRAERLLQRADGIAGDLRGSLAREGSDERPARRDGELVEDEPANPNAPRIGNDSRRLPPGDPSTIYGEGPTADQTQYEPQARTARRDEGLQAGNRMRDDARPRQPLIEDSGTIFGEGPVAGNANTGMEQQTAPPTQSSDAERMTEWERLWREEGVENPNEGDFETIDIRPGEPETDPAEQAGGIQGQQQDGGRSQPAIPAQSSQQEDDPGQAVRVPTERIQIDPESYQFRTEVDDQGTDDRLAGTREWDDLRAGNVVLHEREDGSLFVADGHHRVRLAQELGQPVVNAQIVREADGVSVADARRLAAENNIANDSATALDVAKVFRDKEGAPDEIIAGANLPPQSTLARDGIAISRLGGDAFGAVVNGNIDEKSAATIGRTFSDPDEQLAAVGVFQRVSPTNDTQRTILANEIRNAGFDDSQSEQGGLFGDDPAESLIGERVRVLDRLRGDLVRDRRLFATLNRNAPKAEAAGNRINTQANQQQSDQSAKAVDLLGRVATDPELNQAVNDAARRVRDGESLASVVDELKTRLTNGRQAAATDTQQRADGRPAVRRGQEPGRSEQGPEGDAAQREGEAEPRLAERQDQGLTFKADGSPFASETSALASGVARRAKAQGQNVEAVPSGNGFGVRVGEPQAAESVQSGAESLTLETQTEESLAARELETQQAEQAEADRRREEEQRAQADAEVDDFTLSGSDRQADVLAAGGQQDLTDQSPQETAPSATNETTATPVFETYQGARDWMRSRAQELGMNQREFTTTDEYRDAYPQIQALQRQERDESRANARQRMEAAGLSEGDRVEAAVPGMMGTDGETSTGTIVMRNGQPRVQLDSPMTVSRNGKLTEAQSVAWDDRWEATDAVPPPADTTQTETERTTEAPEPTSRTEPISDFGERIEGARKDQVNQVMSGLDSEVTQSSTLSEAFPAPNYTKLIEEGVDPRAAAFVAVIRNSIPAKPRKAFRLKQWMQQVEQAQDLARMLLDGSRGFDDFLAETQTPRGRQLYAKVEGALRTAELIAPLKPSLFPKAAKWRVDAQGGYSLYDGQKINPNDTLYELRDERGRRTGVWSLDFETMREDAANAIANAVMKDDSKPKSKQTPISIYENTRSGDIFIAFKAGSRKIRLRGGFETPNSARDYLAEHRDELQQQIDAMRAGPKMRRDSNAPREGMELRDGDVTPDDFQESFGFRGVQFGNYVEGGRRQSDLNRAYDALMDLASMMGVPPKAMSLDGTLGLAFGARGTGGPRPAAAHYESGQVVINLTKKEGAGSLAHEWFHALDNYIPHGQGGRQFQTDLVTDGPARAELAERWREMRQALKDSGFEKRSREFDAPRSKAYFGTPIEMAARAFERYTKDKLNEQGIRNDYLVNISSDPEGPYPTDAEIESIAPAFDRLMGTMEHRETARGVELYSLNPSSEALKPAPRAEDIATALEGIEELGDARVIQSARDLPPKALLGMALRGVNLADVRGMYIDGELYVIADNVESVQEGVRTAVHEAVGHQGMRGVLGADLERVMLSLFRSLPNSKEGRQALAEVRRDYPFLDPGKREDRITIGEEMVAHLLEKGQRPKAWQRAVAKIRELLRRLFPSIAWTYTDALALGEKSREYLRKQKAEREGDAGELYSLRAKQRTAFESQFDDFTDADRAAAAKIGARTPPQRAMEWFKEKADRAGLKIRQGMVDRVAALKEMDEKLYGESALGENINRSSWVLARMSGAANGALHAMLHNGRIRLDPKERIIQMQDGDSKGLGEVLGRLGSAAEIERFMGWIAGNRAARLAQDGRENLFDVGDIDAMKGWNRGKMEDGRSREAVYQEVFAEFQQYRDDVLAVAEQSGIISKDQREMWSEEFYVPFYRLAEDDAQVSGMMATSGLSRQQAYKRLKGGTQNLNDLLQNAMMNFHHLLDASLKNQAATQAVENAKQLGMAEQVPESNRDTKKSTFVMEEGRKTFYEIDDPLVFQALTALAHPGMNSTMMKVMRGFKRTFTNLTTTTPQFMVANLIRDSLQAAATNDVSKNVFKNVMDGAGAYRDQRIRAQMLASGASFNFGHLYGNNPDELRSQLTRNMRDAKLVDGPYMVPNVLRSGWAWWNDVNNAAENVNRAAIYSQNREGGELRAAFEARDLIDFSAHGAWPAVRVLIDIVPFLNARIQGLDKIYRSGVKPGASVAAEAFGYGKAGVTNKQAAGRFWTVTGALAAATVALYLHNQDDEEFQKLEDWQRDTYWFFRAGDQAFFIPKPFEVGAIATMAERITEQFVDDQATGKLFAERMRHMMLDTFSFSPVPQMAQPALDIYANYDAFTQRPIESMGMERLSPELRKRASTSKAGEWISSALNNTVGAIGNPETNPLALSPVQVDHLIGGYLGQVGTWVASSGDVAWNVATGKEEPARRWYEYQPIRRFYSNLGDEDRYTKYGTIFYEGLREAGRANADVKELREMGRLADAAEKAESKREILALRLPLDRAQRRLNTINNRVEMIRRSNMDGEIKRQRIDRLRAVKNQIQRALGERVMEARAG